MTPRLAATVVLGALVSSAPHARAQHRFPGLYFAADIQASDVVYTNQPRLPLSKVLFLGDSNALRLQVQNASDTAMSIYVGDLHRDAAFEITAETLPDSAEIPTLSLPAEFELVGQDGRQHAIWQSEIQLQPHQIAEWHATLNMKGPRVSGEYILNVKPRFEGRPSPINLYGTRVTFEVRDTTRQDDLVEQARRRLRHAHFDYVDGNLADASANRAVIEASARRLLTIYPNCADAYEILGLVAQKEGSIAEARRFFQLAVDLVASGQDRLLLAHQDQGTLNKMLERLRADVKAVQQAALKNDFSSGPIGR